MRPVFRHGPLGDTLNQPGTSAIRNSRTLPLLANLVVVFAVGGGMVWFGANTDFKVHALIECILSIVNLFIVGVCLYLARRDRDRFFLIIGLAFTGNWALEMWHVAASLGHAGIQFPLSSAEFSSSSWIAPRLYLATGLLLAAIYRRSRRAEHLPSTSSDILYYAVAMAALAPVVMVSLQIAAASSNHQWFPVPRPEEFVPGVMYLAAAFAYFRRGRWKYSIFEYYLLYSLGMAALLHTAIMPFSALEFDAYYAVAHFFKFTSYLIILVGLLLYGRDVSSDILEDEKQRAETMLQIMGDGILVIDNQHIIKSINPAGCRIFELGEQELIGQDLTRWLSGLALDGRGEMASEQLSMQLELRGTRGDGEAFPLEATFNLLPSKRAKSNRQYVGVIRDISERQAREIERINFNRQLETALTAAGLGKWEWNHTTKHMSWDDQCDKIYGLPAGTRGIYSTEWGDIIHPEDSAMVSRIFDNVNEEGRFRDAEFRIFRRSDGAERWIAMSGTQLVGEGKADDRVVGVLRDVTVLKNNLQDLTSAREAADEASQIKSAFLANMSHEIRTPMNGVVGMLDVLQQSRLNSKQTEMVDIIKESAFSLLGLIDDILDFSKIEAGKLQVDIAPMNVAAVTESVCASLDLLAQESGVELALFTDPNLPEAVMGDGLRLRQVLVNLANNAIKFSKDNTRTGKVCMRTVLLSEDEHTACLEFRVDDNGIGMTQEVQDAVFDIFVQADSSTSRKFGGTGLGLSISKNLVEMMGGDIDLFSVPGEGSTFTVRIELPKATLEDATPPPQWQLENVSCLLIEELGGYSDHLETYLRHAGADVEKVTEVTEALQWLNVQSGARRVCIVDGGTAHLSAVERKLLERENLGIVVIQRERRQLITHIESALVHSGNAMSRRHFLQLVSAAAGNTAITHHENTPETAETTGSPAAPSREEAIRRNALILVAEDNPTNQQVVLEQLTVLGYHADIAINGEEGLERWREGCYSLLLTDLQMPKMDGYDLAAAIRAEEPADVRIPIVALSADALVGEAQRSQHVGMDDYLSKPARLGDLEKMLKKWLGAETQEKDTPASVVEAPGDELPVLDVSQLEALIGTDESRISALLQAYQESSSALATQLINGWLAGDGKATAAAAHQLKSSSLSVGAMRLGQLSADIEATAKATHSVPALDKIKVFESEFDAVARAITKAGYAIVSKDLPA